MTATMINELHLYAIRAAFDYVIIKNLSGFLITMSLN